MPNYEPAPAAACRDPEVREVLFPAQPRARAASLRSNDRGAQEGEQPHAFGDVRVCARWADLYNIYMKIIEIIYPDS